MFKQNLFYLNKKTKMRQLLQAFMASLILNSTPILASNLSPPPNLNPTVDYSCLNRPSKEAVSICQKENAACHATLQKVETPPSPVSTWKTVGLYALGGVILGMVVEGQLKK